MIQQIQIKILKLFSHKKSLKIPKEQLEAVNLRYQRNNQKREIKEEQTIQRSKDTKGTIRSHKSKKNRQYNHQKIPKEQLEAVNQRRTDNITIKRYERNNQKPKIKEEQTIQRPKVTKGTIRSRKSKKNRQYNDEKIRKEQLEAVNLRRTDNTTTKRYERNNQKPKI